MERLWRDEIFGKLAWSRAAALGIAIVAGSYRRVMSAAQTYILETQMRDNDRILDSARQEYHRLAEGTNLRLREAVNMARRLYVPPRAWQLRPEFTGMMRLRPDVVKGLDTAFTTVRKYVPSLAMCSLDNLATASFDSGLSGAFASLVACYINTQQLLFKHQYNTKMEHDAAPDARRQAVDDLKNFAWRPGGVECRYPGRQSQVFAIGS